jgi:ubiquinone/menaquinone biosynthesis C-methylase UbiE
MSHNKLTHTSAKPSHYNTDSAHYDAFNEKNSKVINQVIENILKIHKVKTVLDLTCGTGSQVFWLTKSGYEVVGSDINDRMLKIARNKARQADLNIKFLKGDMRNVQVGQFDAVITIFNAIGHLTKLDFEQAMKNIASNLKDGGLYIFDIFDLSYLMKDDHITDLTIDCQTMDGPNKVRTIQYSTINEDGILASYTTSFVQVGPHKPKISRESQTLQVYTAKQLKEMLNRNGFKVLSQCAVDGSKFIETQSDRILTIAKKL